MDLAREFVRGAVPVHVLHHACAEEVHGTELIDELARHGHRLSPGTLYPLLHRMEEAGLLAAREVVVDGHRRRLYRATASGRRSYAACRRAVAELADEVLGL